MIATQTNGTKSSKWAPGVGRALNQRVKAIMSNVPYGMVITFSMALAQAKREMGVQ